jgi:geranylgeranyl diphosphate synthase, type II
VFLGNYTCLKCNFFFGLMYFSYVKICIKSRFDFSLNSVTFERYKILPMLTFSECQTITDDFLAHLLVHSKQPSELYLPIQYILSLGGKRIRPVSTLLANNMFSDDVTSAVAPAAAYEVFHNFTLVHDDIMDNAPVRRCQPTIHERWNANVAILSGDAMQIVAYQILCEASVNNLKPLLDLFNTTALEVCEGQQFDMNFSTRSEVSLEEYIRMIELKTSVLLAAALKTGAICANAPEEDANSLYEFGRNLGIAFQIQDDYLDVYADKAKFGKKVGGDIAENKKTFLLIKALELATGEQAEILEDAINNKIVDFNEKIRKVTEVFNHLNIPGITRQAMESYCDKAFDHLNAVNVPDERKVHLRELAVSLMNREK